MEKNEPFVYDEVDEEQSPQSNQTWPMDMIRQRRFQHKMSSLLSPVTPKRNYSVSNAKSLLKKYSKSDPIPHKRFPVSCSEEGVLMDGVLVTSASEKKVSDSPSRLSSLGRSPRSSLVRSQHKNSSPRSLSGRNQEDTTRSQTSSGGKVKMLANSPCTKLETPKAAANPSNLKATAEPFTFTPRPSQGQASPLPVRQLPFDHGPHIQWGNPPPHQQLRPSYSHLYLPPNYTYPRSLQVPDLYPTHYPFRSPRPISYQMGYDPRIISLLPTTPLSTNTIKPPVHTPISTIPTANLSISTTTHSSRLDSSLSVDGGLETVTPKQDLSSPSDELETMTQKQGLSSPSDELITMTQTLDLWSPAAELETPAHKPDDSPSAGLGPETVTAEKDWSPSDDRLPRFIQAQTDFMKSQDRVLPDDAFQHYIYRKRLPIFTQICSDDTEGGDNTTH